MQTPPGSSFRPALAGAVLGAIGASVCCVVPLVLVLMGISGAWIAQLTALDAWRPWFTGATLVCLGLAFWTLRRAATSCDADGRCADPALLRRRRHILAIVTVFIALLLLFPYYIGWLL
jgi:mercuric ion transport protein